MLIGLALIAQYLVSALASNLIFMPYADPEKLQDLVKIISPTGFLLLMYVPRVIGVIVFWLIARIVPFERKAGAVRLQRGRGRLDGRYRQQPLFPHREEYCG